MSEDEKIIEDIKEIINRCKECKFATCEQCEINWTQIKTIKHLLDLYSKEKQKNMELEKYKKYYETEKVVWSRKDYISKDKIREKINRYNNADNARDYWKMKGLQELLEERN